MRLQTWILLLSVPFVALPCACAAWDFTYDGDVLPVDAALGADVWALRRPGDQAFLSESSASDGFLHLVDRRNDQAALFYRDDVGPGSPVTIEGRVRVVAADDPYNGLIEPLLFGGRLAFVAIFGDRIGVRYIGMNSFIFSPLDMSEFHVIRLAIEGSQAGFRDPAFTVWVDGAQVFSGPAPGTTGGSVYFGTLFNQPTSESYWDYVRYSNEYLPVPEPSGLLALTSGLTGLLAMRRRRGAG